MRKKILCAGLAVLAMLGTPARAAEGVDSVPDASDQAALSESAQQPGVSQSTSNVAVDGFLVAPEGYCINQENYYKLRDLAFLLTGKDTAFDVVWDDEYQCISMITGRDYTVAGGEMAQSGSAEIYKFVPSYSEVRLNGQVVQMTGFNINNNNYYRIRDVGPLIGFGVDWNKDSSTVVITSGSEAVEPPASLSPMGGGELTGGEQGTATPPASDHTGTDGNTGTTETPGTGASADTQTPAEEEEEHVPWIGPKIDGVLTILLDPGHGGTDIGSYNLQTNQNENTTNLAVATYLKEMLEASGVRVIMSRESTSTTLRGADRKAYVSSVCEQGELDLVLSIHHNGSNAHTARGTEVYVQAAGLSPEAGTDGKADSCEVSKGLGTRILKSYTSMGNGLINRGVKETSTLYMVYLAGEYGIPAVLSEFCFIDNASDVKLIDDDSDLQAEARAIYEAVIDFYANTPY